MKIGEAELEILMFIARSGETTVRAVADHFGEERGWGRTTILKTIDRLRAKGYLHRREIDGVFQYRSTQTAEQIQSNLIGHFVNQTLDGTISPFVAYLNGGAQISSVELEELKALVAKLENEKKGT